MRSTAVLAFLFTTGILSAQTVMEVGDRGVFHLLKGVEIVGKVTASDESTYTVTSLAGDEFTFKRDNVRWIRKFSEGERVVSNTGKIAKFKGLYGNLSSGFGFSAFGMPSQHYSASLGHKFNQWIGVGGGGNIYVHQTNGDGVATFGLYAEGMGYLSDGYILPYYIGRLGYSSATAINNGFNAPENTATGGAHAMLGMGLEFASKSRVRLTLEIAQVYQRATIELPNRSNEYGLNRTMFTLGLAF